MALSGTFQQQLGSLYIYTRVEWTATQNVSARTSTITANLYLYSTGGRISTSNSRAVSLNIGGNTKSGSANFTLAANQKKLLLTHTRTISHNSNGDLSAAISGTTSFAGLMGYNNVTASGTAVLNNIGVANAPSTISLNKTQWKVGSALTYSISRKNSSNTHKIELMLNGTILKTITNPTLSGNLPQFTREEYKRMYEIFNGRIGPGTLTLTVRLYTYSGSSQIGLESAAVDVLGTFPYKIGHNVPNTDLRDIRRSITGTAIENGVAEYFGSYSVESVLKHRQTTSTVYSTHHFNYSSVPFSFFNFNLGNPSPLLSDIEWMENDIEALASGPTSGQYYWESTTYYEGVQVGQPQQSNNFAISKVGAPGIDIGSGFMNFIDLEGLYAFPTLVKNISRPRFNFDWSKVDGEVTSIHLTIGNTTREVTVGASYFDWGLYTGGGTATVRLVNEYGIDSAQTIMISEKSYPTISAQVRAVRQGFTESVRVNFSGINDSLNGRNNITKTELRMGSGSWINVSFNQSGNSFSSSSFRTYTVSLDSTESFHLRVTTKYSTQIFSTTVSPAKPLFYIGEEEKNIGLGKYPRAGNMVDSEYPIYAPVYNFSDGVSLTSINNGFRINNVLDYVDIGITSSYIQFSTNKGTYYFDKQLVAEDGFRVSSGSTSLSNTTASSLVVTGNTSLNNVNKLHLTAEPTTNSIETGRVGIGGWGNGKTATSGSLVGYTVNFRTRKTYTPSSIQLTEGSASLTKTPQAIDIDQDGFWFYFGGDGVESYRYWRGYYRA